MVLKYKVKENDNYINLKDLLKNYFQISDRLLVRLKHNQKLFINGNFASITNLLKANDIVTVFLDFMEDNSNIVPTKIDLDILFEDDSLLIINKTAGIPIHPSLDHYEDSLSNGVRFYFDAIRIKEKN